MRRDDASTLDAAALAADYAEDLIVGTVRDMHGAVAGRFHGINDRINGGGPTVSHRLHDGIAKAVYGGIRVGFRAGPRACAPRAGAGLGADIEATPQGRFVRSAVNGLIGDRLRDEGSHFAFDMGVRVDGRDVVLDRDGVAAAYPAATGRVVVFVHGLSENEAYWNRAAGPRTEARRERPEAQLRRPARRRGLDAGLPRVNTGLPIAENGVALAALLDRLVEAWPVDVRRIALVGHSMGGLIMRAACAVTTDSEQPWTDLVTDVVSLGTPHLGAPLERVVNQGRLGPRPAARGGAVRPDPGAPLVGHPRPAARPGRRRAEPAATPATAWWPRP